MACGHFGADQVSSIKTMKRWYDQNPMLFWVIVESKRKPAETRKRLVGYFCIIPIASETERRLRNGQLVGANLDASDIVRPRRSAAALYLAAVVAKGRKARGAALGHLHHHVTSYWDRKVPVIYSRPVTKDGFRVAERYGFTPVDEEARTLGDLFERHTNAPNG